MPTISAIIPVYNAEEHLHRCIESILTQSYDDFELLLIDDGSTDSSGIICNDYAQKDSRIRVFHKENGGVSSARNVGLDNAKGEYITFVDSDDYILPNFFSIIEDLNVDLFIGSFFYNDTIVSLNDTTSDNLINDKFLFEYLIKTISIYTVWGKLLKSSLIINNNLRFDETLATAEDSLFMCNYLFHIGSIALSKKLVYRYDKQENSGLSHLRAQEWESESIIIKKILNICTLLQDKHSISLNPIRIRTVQARTDSFIHGLAPKSLFEIYKALKELIYDEKTQILWNDNTILQKGERRIIFDFLAKHKYIFLLSLYIKYINPRY